MKPEELKIIAEAMGLKTEIIGNYVYIGTIDCPHDVINLFNPETNWEQTGMMLEWMEKQGVRMKFEWVFAIGCWYVDVYNVEFDAIIKHEDFQTAVCMATLEIAKQLK